MFLGEQNRNIDQNWVKISTYEKSITRIRFTQKAQQHVLTVLC